MNENHAALLAAAKQVIWKLSHNFNMPDYKGPARITRQDATVRMLADAVEVLEDAPDWDALSIGDCKQCKEGHALVDGLCYNCRPRFVDHYGPCTDNCEREEE